MLNQYAVDNPTLQANLRFHHLFQILAECKAVLWECRAATIGRQAFGTRAWFFGNVSSNPTASSSAPYPQGINLWISNVSEHTSLHAMRESQTPNTALDPRCQSGPSDRNSFDLSEGIFSNNYGADQQRLQISDIHFDKFPNPATFACWKTRFKTEVCTCSQFPTEAMLWIKEVEMVDSMDDLKSSSSLRGIQMPKFEVLDARIASALNRIIHNSHFKRRINQPGGTKGPEAGPFPSRHTDRLPDLRVLLGHWRQRFCRELCRLFSNVLQNDDIQEFDSKWDEILLSMPNPPDEILEGLYKLRIRESEKLKTVLELYDLETSSEEVRT